MLSNAELLHKCIFSKDTIFQNFRISRFFDKNGENFDI